MTMPEPANRHVLVTGASRGIGASIARALAGGGARITLTGRHYEPLNDQARLLPEAQAVVLDVSDEQAVQTGFEQAQQRFGPVDILINNAGAAATAPAHRTSTELWQQMIAINLSGVFYCSRTALVSMRQQRWGRIINIASTAGLKGYAYVSAYCAAKHGVIGYTRALALETARDAVTVNAICPGFTETALLSESIDNIVASTGRSYDQARLELQKINPQNRFIQPDEIATTALWLCGPHSDSITGQAIAIAGGEVM